MINRLQTNQMHHIYCIWCGSEPDISLLTLQFTHIPQTSVILLLYSSSLHNLSRAHVEYVQPNFWSLNLLSIPSENIPTQPFVFIDSNFFRSRKTFSFHSHAPLGTFRNLVTQIVELIKQKQGEYWRNNPTTTLLSTRWASNLTRNIRYLTEACFKGPESWSLTNKSVVLLGAGPGMWTYKEQILELATSHYLLAVDTCLPILKSWGIVPDGVLVVESQYWNTLDFIPLGSDYFEEFAGDVFLDLTSNPQILRAWKRAKTWFFLSKFTDSSLLEDITPHVLMIPALGNIGCIGLYLVKLLGFTQVRLFGLDFSTSTYGSLTSGGHHHLWYLTHRTRTVPQPFDHHGSKTNNQTQFLASPIQQRDFDNLCALAKWSGLDIKYYSTLRSSWYLDPRTGLESLEDKKTSNFAMNIVLILKVLEENLEKAKAMLQLPQTIDSHHELLAFFSSYGSLFTLNIPGTVPLQNPEISTTLHPYILVGSKRMVFEIDRALR